MPEPLVIITAVGASDRPGIVAALAAAVLRAGGNLDDAAMTRLHGAFATMIAARVAAERLPALRSDLDALGARWRLRCRCEPIDEDAAAAALGAGAPDHVISVHGVDHPGIVAAVAGALAERGVNITDLRTRRSAAGDAGTGAEPIYVMTLETSGGDWSGMAGGAALADALAALGRSLAVRVAVTEIDAATL